MIRNNSEHGLRYILLASTITLGILAAALYSSQGSDQDPNFSCPPGLASPAQEVTDGIDGITHKFPRQHICVQVPAEFQRNEVPLGEPGVDK